MTKTGAVLKFNSAPRTQSLCDRIGKLHFITPRVMEYYARIADDPNNAQALQHYSCPFECSYSRPSVHALVSHLLQEHDLNGLIAHHRRRQRQGDAAESCHGDLKTILTYLRWHGL